MLTGWLLSKVNIVETTDGYLADLEAKGET